MSNTVKVLGISGSLRSNSTNTKVIKSFFKLLPCNTACHLFSGLDTLPHFDPGKVETEAVLLFKQLLSASDVVIICTPEYAFGVPGVLKNALDWTVSSGEFNEKRVVAISASPLNSGADKALSSLLLTLTALGTRQAEHLSLSIPNIKAKLNSEGELIDEKTIGQLQKIATNLFTIMN